jgi:hypothetical protein
MYLPIIDFNRLCRPGSGSRTNRAFPGTSPASFAFSSSEHTGLSSGSDADATARPFADPGTETAVAAAGSNYDTATIGFDTSTSSANH